LAKSQKDRKMAAFTDSCAEPKIEAHTNELALTHAHKEA